VTRPGIEVALLGSLQLRVGGEPVALSSMPQRVLLARLALASGQAVGVAELLDALWGDQPAAERCRSPAQSIARSTSVLPAAAGYRSGPLWVEDKYLDRRRLADRSQRNNLM
jgi:hypothetical protein